MSYPSPFYLWNETKTRATLENRECRTGDEVYRTDTVLRVRPLSGSRSEILPVSYTVDYKQKSKNPRNVLMVSLQKTPI